MGKAKRQKKPDNPKKGPKQEVSSKSGAKQWMILLGASIVLGFVYNSINPAGLGKEASSSEAIESKAESSLENGGSEPPLLSEALSYHHDGEHNPDGFPIVTWPQVQKLSKEFGALLVDARPEWSFEAGHLPGAVCLPFSFPTTQAFHEFSSQYPKTRPLVIYCGEPSCERSKYLAIKLRDDFDYTNLSLYEGGYEDYLAQTR